MYGPQHSSKREVCLSMGCLSPHCTLHNLSLNRHQKYAAGGVVWLARRSDVSLASGGASVVACADECSKSGNDPHLFTMSVALCCIAFEYKLASMSACHLNDLVKRSMHV